ncbi:MAG: Abi family protein [Bacilli bacterium]|nr:Abi family protein [Bacilli bacterium]
MEILESRGCYIDNKTFALQVLSHINYYRFSSYFLPFKRYDNSDNYIEGTTFRKVYNNYLFDKKLRNLLSSVIEDIEVTIKTKIAYFHSKKFGPLGYLDKENYNNLFDAELLETTINKHKERHKNNPIIIHHQEKYNSNFPLWVIIEFFDFSETSKMYSQLDIQLQKAVARSLNTNRTCLKSWLYCLTHLRNCCAHYARIYNSKMISIPATPNNKPITFDKTIFCYILVIKEIIGETDSWQDFYSSLTNLLNEFKEDIELNRMGFPHNWMIYL